MSKIVLKTLIKNKLNSGRTLRFTKPPVFVDAGCEVLVEGAYPTGCPSKGQAIAMESEIAAGKIAVSIVTNLGILSIEEHNKGVSPSVLKKQAAAKKADAKKAKEDYKKLHKPKVVSGNNPDGMIKSVETPEDEVNATPVNVVGDESTAFSPGGIDENSPKATALTNEHEAASGPAKSVHMFGEEAVVTPVSAEAPDEAIGKPIPVDPNNSKATGVAMPEPKKKEEAKPKAKASTAKRAPKKAAPKKTAPKKAAPLHTAKSSGKSAPRKRGAAPS